MSLPPPLREEVLHHICVSCVHFVVTTLRFISNVHWLEHDTKAATSWEVELYCTVCTSGTIKSTIKSHVRYATCTHMYC